MQSGGLGESLGPLLHRIAPTENLLTRELPHHIIGEPLAQFWQVLAVQCNQKPHEDLMARSIAARSRRIYLQANASLPLPAD
ncbi:hypothetical protein CQ012_11535 [Arthrobacter sp. MYb214]|nr:hypothetical protein CQ012_11535 [Arthrobacter sp. MYb214]